MPKIYFIGVDVGTSSARAALINSTGKIINYAVHDIKLWNPKLNHYEQSSDDIWNSICYCIRIVTKDIPKEEIVGIGFDATCSLVVLDDDEKPLTISITGKDEQNVILWMDHRASKETDFINDKNHDILKYVGGKISPEMEIPKLLWLKNNLNISCYRKIWKVFDLADFLTWKATGNDTRSFCTVVCKWNYDGLNMKWSKEFLESIGLNELCKNDFEMIGNKINEPGQLIGNGLTNEAAEEMGLLPNTAVGTSLIDAHAGALALFGVSNENDDIETKLALICGTSTCHMTITKEPCWAKGIWGPYLNAILPEYYLNEGGQSTAGILIDYLTSCHPYYKIVEQELLKENKNIYEYLNEQLNEMAKERALEDVCYLTKDVHILPDFHGNRSPIADPTLKGMICGLDMKSDFDNFAIQYLALIQSLAYGTRNIIEKLISSNHPKFSTLLFCGGLAKNKIYIRSHADACNLDAIIPDNKEMVLVGAGMIGACASRVYPTLKNASEMMGGKGQVIKPNQNVLNYHNQKYKIFKKMYEDQYSYRKMMEDF